MKEEKAFEIHDRRRWKKMKNEEKGTSSENLNWITRFSHGLPFVAESNINDSIKKWSLERDGVAKHLAENFKRNFFMRKDYVDKIEILDVVNAGSYIIKTDILWCEETGEAEVSAFAPKANKRPEPPKDFVVTRYQFYIPRTVKAYSCSTTETCGKCNGSGTVPEYEYKGDFASLETRKVYMGQVPCGSCVGGKVECSLCEGTGKYYGYYLVTGEYTPETTVRYYHSQAHPPGLEIPEKRLRKAKSVPIKTEEAELPSYQGDVMKRAPGKLRRCIDFIPITKVSYLSGARKDALWLYGTDRKMYPSVKLYFLDWRKVIVATGLVLSLALAILSIMIKLND